MLLKNNIKDIKNIINSDNILTNKEECYCYATDASNYREDVNIPDMVVFVETIEQVQNIVKYANEHLIPIVSRGAGTNMVGACLCPKGGIILNFSKMNRILDINTVNMTAKVQPGVILGDLKTAVEEYGLFYPPDPSNYKVSTVGGSIAQSSGGATSFKYGTTKDYVLSLKVVMANGELVTFGAETIKDASGYHMAQLIVGSEGTLGLVVEATLRLIPKPKCHNVIAVYFNSIDDAVNSINHLTTSGIYPAAIDFMDKNSIITVEEFAHCKFKTIYECLLLIELDGDDISLNSQIEKALSVLKDSNAAKVYVPPTKLDYERIWQARRSSFAASARLAPDVISDDIIVPRANLSEMIKSCQNICSKYGLKLCMVGHVGDGNIHPQIVLNMDNDDEFKAYTAAKSEIYAEVVRLKGTISAEHGIGLEKMPYLNKTLAKNSIDYMKAIKKVFDPNNILNPDKIFSL